MVQVGLLEPANFSLKAREVLSRCGTVSEYNGRNLAKFLAPLDALFVRVGYQIDDKILSMAPKLRYICSPTTGHTHLSCDAIRDRGISLISLRGERDFLETIRATPEHVFGLIIALLRQYAKALPNTLAGQWDRDACRGEELYGNSVGIIGLGRVGYRVGSYCSFFGAEVGWYDPFTMRNLPEWVRHDDIRSVINASRIVVLCASHEDGAEPLLGASEVCALSGKYFVNAARGELVDESALLSAIGRNELAGVACDVVANENGSNLLDKWRTLALGRNVILTPHMAGATAESMAKTELFIANKFSAKLNNASML